jgi:hypothetical protein
LGHSLAVVVKAANWSASGSGSSFNPSVCGRLLDCRPRSRERWLHFYRWPAVWLLELTVGGHQHDGSPTRGAIDEATVFDLGGRIIGRVAGTTRHHLIVAWHHHLDPGIGHDDHSGRSDRASHALKLPVQRQLPDSPDEQCVQWRRVDPDHRLSDRQRHGRIWLGDQGLDAQRLTEQCAERANDASILSAIHAGDAIALINFGGSGAVKLGI